MGKICAKCGVEKDVSEFRVDNKSKDKLGCWCKDCDREYKRKYYAIHRDKLNAEKREKYKIDSEYRRKVNSYNRQWNKQHNKENYARQRVYRSDIQEFIDNCKTECVKCGEKRKWLIQFHHIDPKQKNFQIQATHGIEALKEEMKKCVCLCTNCHTEYHFFFGKSPEKPKESLDNYLSEEFNYDSINP